jgi:hypothetical protein
MSLADQIATFEQQGINIWDVLSGAADRKELTGEQLLISCLQVISNQIQAAITGGTGDNLPQPLSLPAQAIADVSSPNGTVSLVDLETVNIAAGQNFAKFTAPFNGTAIVSISLTAAGALSVEKITIGGASVDIVSELLDGQVIPAGIEKLIGIPINQDVEYYLQSSATGQATIQVVGVQTVIAVSQPTVQLAGNTLLEQQTQANATGGVLTFGSNFGTIEIYNTDTVNAGIFTVNGIVIHVPASTASYRSIFKAAVGGVPGNTVLASGAQSYIISRYI